MATPVVLQASVTKTAAFNGAGVDVHAFTKPFYWDLTITSFTPGKVAVFALQLSTDAFSSDTRTVGLFHFQGPVTVDAPVGMPPKHHYDMPLLAELIAAPTSVLTVRVALLSIDSAASIVYNSNFWQN